MKKIVYAGTPEFAAEILKHLHNIVPENLETVLSRPDAKTGRGKKLKPSFVKQYCLDNKINVFTPANKESLATRIKELQPDLILVAAYGIILPKDIVDNYLCINIHGSLLPQYRGASPIQSSLLNRDKETGITLFKMNQKMDEGDVYLKKSIDISPNDTFQTLHDKLIECTIDLLDTFIPDFLSDNLQKPIKQNHSSATYCKKIIKEDTFINHSDTLSTILGKIKAFSPKPGAIYTLESGKKIKIIDATIEEGVLLPLLVQPEGKKVMDYKSFCLGSSERINLG